MTSETNWATQALENDSIKEINGVKVVQLELVETPLSRTGRGGPDVERFYRRALAYLLEDGTTGFVCAWPDCGYTSSTNAQGIVGGHWKAHELLPDLARTPFKDWTLEKILGALMDADADIQRLNDSRAKLARKNSELETANKDLKRQLAEWDIVAAKLGKRA